MKTLILLFCFSLNIAAAQFKSASIQVVGLTCSMCCYGVERAVQKLDFVEKVTVDLNTNLASVQFKDNADVSVKKLIKSVYDAGFSIGNLSAQFNFKDVPASESFFEYEKNVYYILNSKKPSINKGPATLSFIDKNTLDKKTFNQHKPNIDKILKTVNVEEFTYFVIL